MVQTGSVREMARHYIFGKCSRKFFLDCFYFQVIMAEGVEKFVNRRVLPKISFALQFLKTISADSLVLLMF